MDSLAPSVELRRRIAGKRLIFTVTSGRSGTGLLADLLSRIPGVGSYHEPEPAFADVMRTAQSSTSAAADFLLGEKLPAVAEEPNGVYVETSHLFCKGFVEPLLDLGIVPDVVLLHRPNREVATSLYALDAIPGRTEKGLRYLLAPDDPGVLRLPGWRDFSDYQLCYWYCLEIARRAEAYRSLIESRGGKVVRTSLARISTREGFHALRSELRLPAPTLVSRVMDSFRSSAKVNSKRHGKRKQALQTNELEVSEKAVEAEVSPSVIESTEGAKG